MDEKTIELELRAEVQLQEHEGLKKQLESLGSLHSHTKRLSVMFFGGVGDKKLDVRVRVTNGECEVVVKAGSFGSHDRTETSQKIDMEQFVGMVKIFTQFDFKMKVGERETFNYKLPGDITVSIVSAGPISYVELEKMSAREEVEENKEELKKLGTELGLELLTCEEKFDDLCNRLNEQVDWMFSGNKEDYEKLVELLGNYKK